MGTRGKLMFAFATIVVMYLSAAGSPGPLLRNTPSGFAASRSDAGVAAGYTRTSQPCALSRRRMFPTTAGDPYHCCGGLVE